MHAARPDLQVLPLLLVRLQRALPRGHVRDFPLSHLPLVATLFRLELRAISPKHVIAFGCLAIVLRVSKKSSRINLLVELVVRTVAAAQWLHEFVFLEEETVLSVLLWSVLCKLAMELGFTLKVACTLGDRISRDGVARPNVSPRFGVSEERDGVFSILAHVFSTYEQIAGE